MDFNIFVSVTERREHLYISRTLELSFERNGLATMVVLGSVGNIYLPSLKDRPLNVKNKNRKKKKHDSDIHDNDNGSDNDKEEEEEEEEEEDDDNNNNNRNKLINVNRQVLFKYVLVDLTPVSIKRFTFQLLTEVKNLNK